MNQSVEVGTYRFDSTDLHCPECGAQEMWKEFGDGDYYMGPRHICVACGAKSYIPARSHKSDVADQINEKL